MDWKDIHQATLDMIAERDAANARVAAKLGATGLRVYLDESVGDNEVTIHVGKNIFEKMKESRDG